MPDPNPALKLLMPAPNRRTRETLAILAIDDEREVRCGSGKGNAAKVIDGALKEFDAVSWLKIDLEAGGLATG